MGPNEQRLRAALNRADFNPAIGKSLDWTYQGLNVNWVMDGLRDVAPKLADYGITGRTPDAAKEAFLRLADKMEQQQADLDKSGRALSDAANEFWEAERVLNDNPATKTDPGPFQYDPNDSRTEEQQKLDHNGKSDAYAAEATQRETAFGEALKKVDKQYYLSAVALSEVHGMGAPPDPYAPEPVGGAGGGAGGAGGGGGGVPGGGGTRPPGDGIPVSDPRDPDGQRDPDGPRDPDDPRDPEDQRDPDDPRDPDDLPEPFPTPTPHDPHPSLPPSAPHPGGPLGPSTPSAPAPIPSTTGSLPGHAVTPGLPGPAAGALGAGLAGGAVAGGLTGAIRGATGGAVSGVGVPRGAAPNALGASSRTSASGALGRGTGAAAGSTARGAGAGASGRGAVRGGAKSGGRAGGRAAAAGGRGVAGKSSGKAPLKGSAAVGRNGRRSEDDEDARRERLDSIAETSEWIDDDGAAPGVIG
ncbi:hypothetical protein [Nocardioides bigeumensis]|uniref:PPE domain-containing protein n=1 Tax=Nocardioides bigeumensis TaxID=433657 RepID=A0ABN2YTJ3_9ACTN